MESTGRTDCMSCTHLDGGVFCEPRGACLKVATWSPGDPAPTGGRPRSVEEEAEMLRQLTQPTIFEELVAEVRRRADDRAKEDLLRALLILYFMDHPEEGDR